jgi:hypothetical protein
LNNPTLCVGADIHLDEIVLRAVDQADGHEVIPRFRVTNNLPGAEKAAATLAAAASSGGYAQLQIDWEATRMLWIPFHRFLITCPHLHPFALCFICFNPQLVGNFKNGLVLRKPKNDERDALDVATRLCFGELPLSYPPTGFWQSLRRLTRYRYRLACNLGREKMRFQSYSYLRCSDWKRVKPLADALGATSAALLTEFTAGELRAMTREQLVDVISHRGRRFHDPDATARAVQQTWRSSYPIDPQMDEMVSATLATAWEHIRFTTRLMKRTDKHIARHIHPIPNSLITFKGLGNVVAAGRLRQWPRRSTSPASPGTHSSLSTSG